MASIRKPFNKTALAAVSSGVAAAVIFCFGIKQCTDKKSAYAERDDAKAKTEQVVKEVNVVIDSLCDENSALRREIHECDTVSGNLVDEVNALNDSISSLNESLQDAARKLEDAQKQKVRPAVRRTQPRKQKITGPGAPEKVRPGATRRMPETPRVQVVGGDEVVVQRPGQGTVVVGDGNAVVVGNGNTVVVNANREKVNAATDTLKQYSVTITRQWIGKRRVK